MEDQFEVTGIWPDVRIVTAFDVVEAMEFCLDATVPGDSIVIKRVS